MHKFSFIFGKNYEYEACNSTILNLSISYTKISLGLLNYRPKSIIPSTPNDLYMGPTAPLTSKRCILYIYLTNVGTEYFKNALYSPFFSLQNAVCFIMLTCLVPVLFTFCIQSVLKLKKKIIPAPKDYISCVWVCNSYVYFFCY